MIDLRLGDCLTEMPKIPDKTIDMILCDLPYGTTACKWDTIIPFEPLWEQYKRIIKDNGAIVLTASQPFTSALVMSNIKMFKYEWIWDKKLPSGMQIAKYRPMQRHENILIFSNGTPKYNPIKVPQKKRTGKVYSKSESSPLKHDNGKLKEYDSKNPQSIIEFYKRDKLMSHPTQKPVALFEYLIKTYTNEGDLVLDNAAGSGTTGVACKNLKRNCILIEKDEEYFKIAERRINNTTENLL
uniref:Putative methyltransferase n=1 Tax=viral metagenome TaxID=1070528 RepID=A0A6M3LU07_9ZZZZ